MPKIRRHLPLRIGGDLVILALSFLAASYLARRHLDPGARLWALGWGEVWLLAVLLLVWGISSRVTGLYDEFRARGSRFGLGVLVSNCLVQALASIVILFALKTQVLNRYFLVFYFLIQAGLLILWRTANPLILRWIGINLARPQNLVIVGTGRTARDFHRFLKSMPHLGVRVLGFVDDAPKPDLGENYLGTIDDLEALFDKHPVDEVILAMPEYAAQRIARVIDICEQNLIPVRIIPSCYHFVSSRYDLSVFGHFPVISLRRNPLEEAPWRYVKRGLDLALTVPLFVFVFSWLWPFIALAIKLDSRGPVFFRQERWGRENRRFVCYKFRSMISDSRDCDENGRYLPAQRTDTRLTRVGRLLRSSSLDELPQFINVFRGEMSIVGPRPHPMPLESELKDKVPHYRLRYLVKPGLTGWAQVHGLRGPAMEPEVMQRRIAHDVWYIENWSIKLDVRIMLRTLWVVLRGDTNAF